MKHLLFICICILAIVIPGFGQLPEVLLSDLNQSNGTLLHTQTGFAKIPSGSSADSTFQVTNGSVIALNGLGTNHYGGVFSTTLQSNNGTDELIVGAYIPAKSTSPAYNQPNSNDIRIYLLANQTTAGFSCSFVDIGPWDSRRFWVAYGDITSGTENARYGGSGNGNHVPDAQGVLEPGEVFDAGNNDTIYVGITGQTMKIYLAKPTGKRVLYSQTARQALPSTGYCGWHTRVSAGTTTQLGALFLGVATYVPPTCSTRDTTFGSIVSLAPNVGVIDTGTTAYWTMHINHSDTCLSKRPGSDWSSMVTDTITGVHLDSTHITHNHSTVDTTYSTTPKKRPAGSYVMVATYVTDSGKVTQTKVPYQVTAGRYLWVSAYYDVWQMTPLGATWWSEPPDRLNYKNGVSHIIIFPNGGVTTSYPWYAPVSGGVLAESLDVLYGTGRPNTPTHYADSLVANAHRNNVRVLVCVNAVCATNLTTVIDANNNGVVDGADSAQADQFAYSLAAYLSRHNFDGADLNIEHGCGTFPGKANIGVLLRRVRVRLDQFSAGIGGKMTLTISPTSGDVGNYPVADINNCVDQVNPQTYDNQYAWNGCVGSNCAWEAGPIYPPSNAQLGANAGCFGAGNLIHNVSQHGPQLWATGGVSKSRLGLGVSTYGRLRSGTNNRFGAFTNDGYAHNTAALVTALLGNGGTQGVYDTVMKSIAISGTALQTATYEGTANTVTAGTPFYFSYPNPQRVQDDITYIKANGFSGYMLFDYQMDCDPSNANISARNPVIEAAGQAAGGQIQASTPNGPTNISPATAATNQVVFGLVFKWSKVTNATNYHFQISTDPSFSALLSEMDLVDTTVTVGSNPFLTSLGYGVTYYWRANATTSVGVTAYSSSSYFYTLTITVNPPHTPTAFSPINNQTITNTSTQLNITTNGTDTISVNIYQMKAIDSTVSSYLVDDSSSGNLYRGVFNLSNGVYYWRAASKNTAGKSAFTAWQKFTINVPVQVGARHQQAPWLDKNRPINHTEYPAPGLEEQDLDPSNIPFRPDSGILVRTPTGYLNYLGVIKRYQVDDPTTLPKTVVQPWTFNNGMVAPNATITNLTANTINAAPVDSFATRAYARATPPNVTAGSGISVSFNGNNAVIANTAAGSTNPDTTIGTHIHLVDEFIASFGAPGTLGGSAGNAAGQEVGDLHWHVHTSATARARVLTYGQQFANTSTFTAPGAVYFTNPDSAVGATPIGAWATLGYNANAPLMYGRPTNAIMYARIIGPKRDSTIAFIGFVDDVGIPLALHDDLTQNTSIEIGSKYVSHANSATAESINVVTCTGAAKTRTPAGVYAQGAPVFVKVRFNVSSIDFYFGTTYAGLGAAVNIATNLPTFTNGMSPFWGAFTWQQNSTANQVSSIVMDAWQFDYYLAR